MTSRSSLERVTAHTLGIFLGTAGFFLSILAILLNAFVPKPETNAQNNPPLPISRNAARGRRHKSEVGPRLATESTKLLDAPILPPLSEEIIITLPWAPLPRSASLPPLYTSNSDTSIGVSDDTLPVSMDSANSSFSQPSSRKRHQPTALPKLNRRLSLNIVPRCEHHKSLIRKKLDKSISAPAGELPQLEKLSHPKSPPAADKPTPRTNPYVAPYFFPLPGSPEAVNYVRQAREDRLRLTTPLAETTVIDETAPLVPKLKFKRQQRPSTARI